VNKLKKILDKFYREYNFKERALYDPVEFPHRYNYSSDIEVSAFIASCFAYGKVNLFKEVVNTILSTMGKSPYDFLLHFSVKRHSRLFEGIRYRFNENADIVCMLFILHEILKKCTSLENVFKRFYEVDDMNIEKGLVGLVTEFLKINTSKIYGKNIKTKGLTQFFPSPVNGSACKRANLFLRWMVRERDIDFGIWKGIPKKSLVIPLDIHIARISRCLGFTVRSSQDWKMAVEITESLKKFDPEDPLKYDFALCHHGISGLCKGRREKAECKECVFKSIILKG
jgi:uncharacterized protein (TIGR02757 family)